MNLALITADFARTRATYLRGEGQFAAPPPNNPLSNGIFSFRDHRGALPGASRDYDLRCTPGVRYTPSVEWRTFFSPLYSALRKSYIF